MTVPNGDIIRSGVHVNDRNNWVDAAQILEAIAVTVALGVALFQIRGARRARDAQLVTTIISSLQHEEMRADRKVLYGIKNKALVNWTDEEKNAAERVAGTFNWVGFLARKKLISRELLIENWGTTIVRCWTITLPRIEDRRAEEDDPELWQHFYWLKDEAS